MLIWNLIDRKLIVLVHVCTFGFGLLNLFSIEVGLGKFPNPFVHY